MTTISGRYVPRNAAAVSEADARKLVKILAGYSAAVAAFAGMMAVMVAGFMH